MSFPHVLFRLLTEPHTTEEVIVVPAGGLIGRLRSAALCIQRPQISEVHAVISLRGRHLELIALRGGIGQGKGGMRSITLKPGQRIKLAEGVKLEVIDVVLPEAVLGLRCDGSDPVELNGQQASIIVAPSPRVTMRFVPEAPAHLWKTGPEWLLQVGMGPTRAVEPGDQWSIGPHTFTAVLIPLSDIAIPPTAPGTLHPPMHMLIHYDQLTITPQGRAQLVIGGKPARIAYELCQFRDNGSPLVPKLLLAEEIWRDGPYSTSLTGLFERSLKELRRKLKAGGLRGDLIRSNNSGSYELNLYPGDTLDSTL
ncbi:MAG: hypothetical protein ACI8RZ_005891 [Myxococcota bacterium]|jgi:hypothetical protein